MSNGEGDQTDFSGVNYDSVVENCLSEEVRATIPESWSKFRGKGLDDLFKSHLSAEQEMSRRVRIPDDDTSDEDRRKFHTTLGCPEKPDDYEFDIDGEVDQDFINWAQQTFHTEGVSKGSAAKLVEGFNKYAATRLEDHKVSEKKAEDEGLKNAGKALRKKWLDKYDDNLLKSRAFYDKTFAPIADLLAEKGLNNHPEVIGFMHEMAEAMGEDVFIPGKRGGRQESTEAMLNRMYPDDAKKKQ